MEPDEVRAEVERIKKRAETLRIRETLWALHRHFSHYETLRREDPEWIYPELGETLEFANNQAKFSLGQTTFNLIYKEQPVSQLENDRTTPGTFRPDMVVSGTLALRANDQRVFKFEFCKRTEYRDSGPQFYDNLGEITRFIEGPWLADLGELLQRIEAHRNRVRNKREAPRRARELEAMKKRFGI